MFVLGRPCELRQLTRLGQDVALVHDLTVTIDNSRSRPQADHFTGTDLVVDHVADHLETCSRPTIKSVDPMELSGRSASLLSAGASRDYRQLRKGS